MTQTLCKLAILDWGIGGMGYYKLFKKLHPKASVFYFSDTGALPYGKQSRTQLKKRLQLIADFLHDQGATHLVIACNAASSALDARAKLHPHIECVGVITPILHKPPLRKGEKVGVIGGIRTIRSGRYRRALLAQGCQVQQRFAQPLSALIENGNLNRKRIVTELQRILSPLKNCNSLILACTHYPAIAHLIAAQLPQVLIIDPAKNLIEWTEKHWPRFYDRTSDIFMTTGNITKMRQAAFRAFSVRLHSIQKISLSPKNYHEK